MAVNETLSSVVDLLTVAIERRDDPRLRKARELVLDAAFPRRSRVAAIVRFITRKAS